MSARAVHACDKFFKEFHLGFAVANGETTDAGEGELDRAIFLDAARQGEQHFSHASFDRVATEWTFHREGRVVERDDRNLTGYILLCVFDFVRLSELFRQLKDGPLDDDCSIVSDIEFALREGEDA